VLSLLIITGEDAFEGEEKQIISYEHLGWNCANDFIQTCVPDFGLKVER
jgi:hypothetical protein